MHRRELAVRTSGRGFIEITKDVAAVVSASGVADGLCNVFVQHTSAVESAADARGRLPPLGPPKR